MPIQANSGEDITQIIRAINRGENIESGTPNYAYGGWTLLHCAASVGNKEVLKQLLKTTGDSIDIQAEEPQYYTEKTPRIILQSIYPAILSELEQEGHI
jgi:ankyrin repeat protein